MITKNDSIILGVLIILCVFLIVLSSYVRKQKNKKQLQTLFITLFDLMLIWLVPMIFQILVVDKYNISIKYFYYLYYIGICFIPIVFFFISIIFEKGKLTYNKKYILLFIIPITSLLLLWTNDLHHAFYVEYSTSLTTEYGWYFNIHTYYTFGVLIVSLIRLIKYSIKNSGFFSKQALLIFIGAVIPLGVNILGSLQIVPVSIYATPIAFAITIICYTFAIFRFKFLGLTPIALQRIVDQISDSYIVLDEDGRIVDYNKTFLDTFKIRNATKFRGKNLAEMLKDTDLYVNYFEIKKALPKDQDYEKETSFELYIQSIKKYFNIEVSSIMAKKQYLGTLVLFKDITQHKKDIQTIKNTQDSLMESERLSSLGQLIGGIAHNLKTPIMSISGAAEGLTDLIKEYDESIEDPTVNYQDHHEIAKDMAKWVKKIKSYSEYMSDIITAVKGQAVVLGNEEDITFTIVELIKRVKILMKHELKNALINLDISCNIDENIEIHGDVNNLVQVINNMISNAIQAYNGKQNETIKFIINQDGNNIVFSIEDNAGGLPEKVKSKIFKEMITTKGKNGTGLGMYISYSTIKAHFNGNITYETKSGVGTRFDIAIPLETEKV